MTPTTVAQTYMTLEGHRKLDGVDVHAPFFPKRLSVSANTTVRGNHNLIGVSTSGGARTITLGRELLRRKGSIMVIKDESGNAATNNITVSTESGNIDGSASSIMNTNYGRLALYSDGSNFFILWNS